MTALPPVVILAGGKATRLAGVLPGMPKILAPVGDRPFLDILLARLLRQGFTQAHFCLGVKSDMVIDYMLRADIADLKVSASLEEEPLGTGGAIVNGLGPVRGTRFFVLNGDSLIDFDAAEMLAHHLNSHQEPGATVLTTAVDDTSRFGSVESANGRVIRFGEKTGTGPGRINAGVYLIDKGLVGDDWPLETELSLERDMFPKWTEQNRVAEFPVDAPLLDIGTPEDLAGAPRFIGENAG